MNLALYKCLVNKCNAKKAERQEAMDAIVLNENLIKRLTIEIQTIQEEIEDLEAEEC